MRDHFGGEHACADHDRAHHDDDLAADHDLDQHDHQHHDVDDDDHDVDDDDHHDDDIVAAVPVADPPVEAVGRSGGEATERAQWRLLELGFWVQERQRQLRPHHAAGGDGVPEVLRARRPTARSASETAAVMSSITERPKASADAGTLVEIDKSKQLLFFIIDGYTEWILNTSTGSEIPYDEPDKNTPGERQVGDSVTRNGLHDVYRELARGMVGGRPRQDLPTEVLLRRRSGARLEQHPQLSRVARLRAGERAGDGLDLGLEPDADAHPGLGPRPDPHADGRRDVTAR